jgi:hypothetical protein
MHPGCNTYRWERGDSIDRGAGKPAKRQPFDEMRCVSVQCFLLIPNAFTLEVA